MTLSYIDPRTGEWKAGLPPGVSLAEAQARVARARHGKRLELADGPSSVHPAPEFTETLAEAQARRRAHQAERGAALDLSDAAVKQRADALQRELADWRLYSGDGARVDLEDAAEQATPKADALLAEMRRLGLMP